MDIRNICLLGHGGSGKTSLVESMLYLTGVTDRLASPRTATPFVITIPRRSSARSPSPFP